MLAPNRGTVAAARRRGLLAQRLGDCAALLMAGRQRTRNYPNNPYPFRPHSHFLYFFGAGVPDAAALLDGGRWTLFVPEQSAADLVWQGQRPTLAELAEQLGCAVEPRRALDEALRGRGVATLPAPDEGTAAEQTRLLHRAIVPQQLDDADEQLADAIIELRLRHDDDAVTELRSAGVATVEAHGAGMRTVRPGAAEWTVAGAIRSALAAAGMNESFSPIVTTHGEFLHMESSEGIMKPGDLLLVDAGAETRGGWAGDVTRTWPVGGRFSPTQRVCQQIVLGAQKAAMDAAGPGTRYRDVHLAAARAVAAGLVEVGILHGHPAELVADGVVAAFLPHGVGHLLGLDVHDMEDLGDRCGYPRGRQRSDDPVLRMLRLDRDLEPGMAVTIEPGLYFNPHLLADPDLEARAGDRLDRAALAQFTDVHGIRIEDDILITPGGHELLTPNLPKAPDDVEASMARAS